MLARRCGHLCRSHARHANPSLISIEKEEWNWSPSLVLQRQSPMKLHMYLKPENLSDFKRTRTLRL